MTERLIEFIRDLYKTKEFIPLHAPTFAGNEMRYVSDTIESTFVSSVGKYVDDFERKIESFTGSPKAVAIVNGTAALHTSLYMAGVKSGDYVITQALTFVATCNALHHMGAEPIFVDVSKVSLSLCPKALDEFLTENAIRDEDGCFFKSDRRRISAVVPMHTFGHPAELDELVVVCDKWNITLVEDAAESLGSFYKGKHTGTIGDFGALSFNGNKIITTGGGGMVLCKDLEQGKRTKHVTTTAKVPHPYEFLHDEPGFNYRLPNLNAALGCAQMERLELFLAEKRALAQHYKEFFADGNYHFVEEPSYGVSNYWLNAIVCESEEERDNLLLNTNEQGVMTRPIWKLMHRLPMFASAHTDDLINSLYFEQRLVNLPSSPRGFV
ncbi:MULTISPECIES: LegC family aminotransferase [Gammaproteobacteria]|uniref:LegC family aminotransferase n=1 Tax=Gammaproteobacteria TaxID=1236 RepID=UPI000DCFA0F6|nr:MULTISPECIES: LegC family aminotransferase [Gammaproteobacteria]RTE86070.1 LegC family aminotransferase [Aliidiomarina sp. B3213]TCZ91424.1 LegC family aminotransferase [Lysobacter sp. N42]